MTHSNCVDLLVECRSDDVYQRPQSTLKIYFGKSLLSMEPVFAAQNEHFSFNFAENCMNFKKKDTLNSNQVLKKFQRQKVLIFPFF